MEFKEIGYEGVYWIHLAQHRDQRRILLHCSELSGFVKRGKSLSCNRDYLLAPQ
jgi:hypothetical protein